MKERKNETKLVSAVANAVYDADAGGSIAVDLAGYNSALITAHVGVSGATLSGTNKIEIEVEERLDGTNYTDVANADLIGAVSGATNPGTFAKIVSAADDDAVYTASYIGNGDKLKVKLNFSGTHSSGTPIGVTVTLQDPIVKPVA